jgi:hypothetical protein
MEEDLRAGKVASGRETIRMPEEQGTRRAKLRRKIQPPPDGQTADNEGQPPAVDEPSASDDFYYDALLRFGIQI